MTDKPEIPEQPSPMVQRAMRRFKTALEIRRLKEEVARVVSDFYDGINAKEQADRTARIFRDRPENLHDYQGCSTEGPRVDFGTKDKLPDFIKRDREEAQKFADWMISVVNADHHDTISFNRDVGCRIRDHIETLRRDLAKAQEQLAEKGGRN